MPNLGPVSIWDVNEPLRTTSTLAVTILSDSCVSPRFGVNSLRSETHTDIIQKPANHRLLGVRSYAADRQSAKLAYVTNFIIIIGKCLTILIQNKIVVLIICLK